MRVGGGGSLRKRVVPTLEETMNVDVQMLRLCTLVLEGP